MSTARISGRFLVAMLCAPLLMGGACEKKKAPDQGAVGALDRVEDPNAPVDTTPLEGIDVKKLPDDRQKLFYKLVGSLKSPCGKAESLRKSFTSDTSCKRALYAVRYLVALFEDEATDEMARKEYAAKYEAKAAPIKLDVAEAPRIGNADAPVRLIEFFDYACPHCQSFKPVLDKVASDHAGKVVEYFMMFPTGAWPESKSAAQAAIAAHAQGKFKEMHAILFAKSPEHGQAAVLGYAKELSLDVAKFQKDYEAAGAQVEADRAQAETNGVKVTPTLIFNDRKYEGPLTAKYIGLWIEEELAVNR